MDLLVTLVKGRGVTARAAVLVVLSLLCGGSALYNWMQAPLTQGEMQVGVQVRVAHVLRVDRIVRALYADGDLVNRSRLDG